MVLADVMAVDNGIPFYLLKCAFCAQFASVNRIIASHCPPKGDLIDILSMDCQIHLIAFLWSYSFNNQIHIFLKMPN
jgi:hypothetical protein